MYWLDSNLYDVLADTFAADSSSRDLDHLGEDKVKNLLDLSACRFSDLCNSDLLYSNEKLSPRGILVTTFNFRIAHNTLHDGDLHAQHKDEEVR